MRKIIVLLVAIIIVVGFVNVVGAENKTKKTKPVSLQTFVNSVAGRTYQAIVARFGEPSCEGGNGILYENFVKDERTGEMLSVYIDFLPGFPVGIVKRREGKMVVSFSDMRPVAANIFCRYYRFMVKSSEDPVVQSYNIYVIDASKGFLAGWVPSCEAINRQKEQMKEEAEREEGKKKFRSAVEKLIGKQISVLLGGFSQHPDQKDWQWKYIWAIKDIKYFVMPIPKRQDWLECYVREDKYKDGVDYFVFECHIDSEKNEIKIILTVYIQGKNSPVRYETAGRESYMEGSPIDLIASKIKAELKMKNTEQITPTIQEKIVTVTWTLANIRSGAGNDYPVVASVNQGDKLNVIGESGEWLNVRLEDGKEGWISNRVVK